MDSRVHRIDLRGQGTKTYTLVLNNKANYGAIRIIKQDVESKEPLAGAVFEWKDTTNDYTQRVTTGWDGTVTISGLSVNRVYEIREVQAPAGYSRNTTPTRVSLTQNHAGQTIAIVRENRKYRFIIRHHQHIGQDIFRQLRTIIHLCTIILQSIIIGGV